MLDLNVDDIYLPGQEKIEFPPLIKLRQSVDDDLISISNSEIRTLVHNRLPGDYLKEKVKSNGSIAIAVGSRAIDRLDLVLSALIRELKRLGYHPFIIPAMGSHGGGTAEGQRQVLEEYGISENRLAVPVKSSMAVNFCGNTADGMPVFCDSNALKADGIIVVNRIKVHPSFGGEIESGLLKMMVVGLGKQNGAQAVHKQGLNSQNIINGARLIMEKAPIVLGVGLVENNSHKLSLISIEPKERIESSEKELLKLYKQKMLKLPFKEADILIVDEMGKNISGAGMDFNIIGRIKTDSPKIKFIIPLSLTKESLGNMVGISEAAFISKKFAAQIDLKSTYTNLLTCGDPIGARIPVILKDDKTILTYAILLCQKESREIKLARIKNTLDITEIRVSKSLYDDIHGNSNITSCGGFEPLIFNSSGDLI